MKPRYLLFYLIGRIVLGLVLTFIFPEMGFFGFIGKYWWFLILVSISYFTSVYFIGYEEKKYLYLRRFLLVGNIYLALHLFFRPLLNIEPALFLLLAVVILLMWYISQLYMKYKWPFYTIGSILCFLIMISGLFYLYPEEPDVKGFISSQTSQLILISPSTQVQRRAYLKLTQLENWKNQELLFETGVQYFSLPEMYQLSYISSVVENEAEVFILFPDGNLFQIFPQSVVHFQEKLFLEIWSFLQFKALRTGNVTTSTQIVEDFIPIPSLLSPEKYLSVNSLYWQNFTSYLTQQIWSNFTASATMQMINRKLLFFLADIFPGFFSKNIENAQLFEYYFNILNKNFPLLTSDKYILSHTTTGNSLRNQIKQNFQLAFPLLKSF